MDIVSYNTSSTALVEQHDLRQLIPAPFPPPPGFQPPFQYHPRVSNYWEHYWLPQCGPVPKCYWKTLDKTGERHRPVILVSSSTSNADLYVDPSRIAGAGLGLFTADTIEASKSPFLYYTGEVLTEEEVRLRYQLQSGQPISMAERKSSYLARLSGVYIDASDPQLSGAARYINHQPGDLANCKLTQYGGIVAIKTIPPNTEITYCYSGRWTKFLADEASSSSKNEQQ